jgi:GTPase SAR1 family protein
MSDEFKKIDSSEIINPISNLITNSTSPNLIPQPESDEIKLDPNEIEVTISDSSPIIVLFGARTSGKTMTLIRLTRYLQSLNYQVKPDPIFRSGFDPHYEQLCNDFAKTVNSNSFSEEGTAVISFMLVKIIKNGVPVCQILEAPGEHYFDADDPNKPFPPYIQAIKSKSNLKTWVFIVEQDWKKDQGVRNLYAEKIKRAEGELLNKRDKIIFTCHKADQFPELIPFGQPNVKQFFKNIKGQYPGIFDKYKNKNPITSLFREFNFDFAVFSAGTFAKRPNRGGQTFTSGDDRYPAILWKVILKAIKGGFWF